MKKRAGNIFSRVLTVLIVFLVAICMILFFKIITNEDVSIGGIRFYYVATESMYPTIKPHAMMVVKETDPEKLQEGDVISFVSRDPAIYGQVNTHRIYAITEDNGQLAFVTKGDNNPVPDSLLVYPDEIKGKVIAHTPPMKGLTSVLSFAGTRMGFFIVILLPLMLVAAMFFGSFVKEFQNSLRQETAELERLRQEQLKAQSDSMSVSDTMTQNGQQIAGAQQSFDMQIWKDAESNTSEAGQSENNDSDETAFHMEGEQVQMAPDAIPQELAAVILEQYFGKSLGEITEEDIVVKLNSMDSADALPYTMAEVPTEKIQEQTAADTAPDITETVTVSETEKGNAETVIAAETQPDTETKIEDKPETGKETTDGNE